MAKIRVLVVEDSLTVRKRLCEILSADPDLEIVGEAADGQIAIEMCQRLHPDVITMDLVLPVMNGLAATEYIMTHCPTPICVLSGGENRGDLFKNAEVYAAGALSVLDKDRADGMDSAWETNLVSTVWLLAHSRAIPQVLGTECPTNGHEECLGVAHSAPK